MWRVGHKDGLRAQPDTVGLHTLCAESSYRLRPKERFAHNVRNRGG